MATIEVKCETGNYTVQVDDEDYERLSKKTWWDLNGYAVTYRGNSVVGMHRLIMGVTDRRVKVDHKHGDRRDCRRSELQVSDPAKSKKKRIPLKPTEEPGIYWSEFKKRFVVILYHPATESRYFFGDYKLMEKAIRVRNAERDGEGYKTTRTPRSWDKLRMPQDEPPAPPTTLDPIRQ